MLDKVKNPPVNGIDLDALFETIEAVKQDPAIGRVAFRVSTDWLGQSRSASTIESFTLGSEKIARSFTVLADEPAELLGTNSAPNPQELLMSAVNACMTVGYVAQAAIRGIALDSCRIEMEGELDLRGFLGLDPAVPAGYPRLDYTVFLAGDGTPEQYAEIHEAVKATSPNFFNLAERVEMHGRLG